MLSVRLIDHWQQPHWHQVINAISQNTLPHAMLLSGVEGLGKYFFAKHVVHQLHCLDPHHDFYCGRCRPCKAIAQEQYPDHLEVTLSEGSQILSIDQIRHVNDFLSQTPHDGQRQTVIIRYADQMHHAAANALLKTLEEPMGEAFLILLDNQNKPLLPTIYSRLQCYDFNHTVSMNDFQDLESTHNKPRQLIYGLLAGAPLKAGDLSLRIKLRDLLLEDLQALAQRKVDMAALVGRWLKEDLVLLADIWMGVVSDLLKIHGNCDSTFLLHSDREAEIFALAHEFEESFMLGMSDCLLTFKSSLISGCNLNKETLLHQIFWRWYRV